MPSLHSLTRLTGIFTAVLCMALSPAWAQDGFAPETDAAAPANLLDFLEGDHVLGNPDAPVKVIEYASLSCSHCMRSHTQTFPQLKTEYIDTGKIAYIYRHFPFNEPALRGAMLTECVGEDKFFRYLKVLFDSQPEWAYGSDFLNSLRTIARIGGLGDEAFDACMANKEVEDRLISGIKWAAGSLQVESTPTIFVNGQKLSGFQSFDELSAVIETERKKATQ